MRGGFAAAIIGFVALFGLISGSGAQSTSAGYQTAVQHLQRGEFPQALAILEQLLDKLPNDLKTRNLIGIALSAAGRPEEANLHFKKLLEASPEFYPALKNLAVNELRMGKVDEARQNFEKARKLVPHDPAVHWGLGEIETAAGHFDQASKHYEQSGDLAFQQAQSAVNFARSYAETGRTGPAAEVLEKLPGNATAKEHFAAGVILAEIENYPAAAKQFALAQDGFPDPYQAGFNRMLALVKSQDFGSAIAVGQELISKGSRESELYNLLAQAYDASGKVIEAYEALRTATQLDPPNEANYLDLITLCLNHQNYDLGLEIADIGLHKVPGSNRLHLNRGVVLAMKGQFDEGQKEFERAAQLAPEKGLAYVALGLVQLQLGALDEAVATLRKRTQTDPTDHLAHWFLAESLIRQGAAPGSAEEEEAVSALRKSIELDPAMPQTRTLLGKTLLRRGDLKGATEQLEKSLEIDPNDLAATYQLARVLQSTGHEERAKELFAKVSKERAEDRNEFTESGLMRIVREGGQ